MDSILGVHVLPSNYAQVVHQALAWAADRQSRTLAFANVHVVMEAVDDPAFRSVLAQFDMINPDGVPLVWTLKLSGHSGASRVYGPDCTLAMLRAAAQHGVPVGFYGGQPDVLEVLLAKVRAELPSLSITYAFAPPFRPLSQQEDEAIVQAINDSGARILFVGLGCPKQERWVVAHAGRIHAVMFAVGAAFDFIAGSKKQAPAWMMRLGLEWAFRFATEPRRLARRYLRHNPRFVFMVARQLLFQRA